MDIKIYKGRQEKEVYNIDLDGWKALGWSTEPVTPAVIPAPKKPSVIPSPKKPEVIPAPMPKPEPIQAPIETPARRRGRPSRK
jgi:hypothetical protein